MATKRADIQEFVAQVAKITGKTFIVDPKLKGQVTVISDTPLGKDGVYALFLSVLRLQNYTAVPSGDVVRIQQSATGKQTPGVLGRPESAAPEELMTEVIAVQNTASSELLKLLRPLIPQYGHIGSVTTPNVVIISDHADNILRLKKLIREIDVADEDEVVMVPLQEAWVGSVASILEKVAPDQIGSSAKGPNRVQVIANERNNSLVLRGKPRPIADVIKIIDKLDRPATTTDATQVVLLSHADAENISKILSDVVAKGAVGKNDAQQEVTIAADTTLNAIVVKADPGAMSEILTLLEKLDTPRAQVMIEAAIVEVTMGASSSLGVEMAGGDQRGNSAPLVSTSLNGVISGLLAGAITDGDSRIDVLEGLATLTSPTLAGARINTEGVSFGAIVNAIANNSDANLLSTPSILTLDNQEAKILVGREVPFRTGSFSTTGDGTSNPFTTVNRQDVGVELVVTPHVFENNDVRMEVSQNITNVLNTTVGGTAFADVVTSKRTIETTVLAANGQTIVLGGLIQDDINNTNNRVPVLGKIPLLGALFRSTSKERTKTNLLVFLRPTILQSTENSTQLSLDRYQQIWELDQGDGTQPASVDSLDGLFNGKRPE
ncbi:MAG: type II secretion system secretin GspD [Pseudomonadota bacterium]|nr:type II secretion system secretin GspD [Pseudomonadota bacterium]MEC7139598.1 type II secretion system secretin GspD [Pseudomonadota bacterium]MEC7250517.1 type II secretion system secretin GspD [Pseudomonadota bacterium]MEC7419557.1 type II secretion system secretin GspD [Pseudomonadota bacterium]MEC8696217.1 type II secretion system secretin GspD [Pseudomonadota bacterium]